MSDSDTTGAEPAEADDLEAQRRAIGEAFEATAFMRLSERRDAVVMREFLRSSGIDPDRAVLAAYGPDQMCFMGVLLSEDEHAYAFDVEYRLAGPRDFWAALQDVHVELWRELTDEERADLMYLPGVNVGRVLLQLQRSDPDLWRFWWDWALERQPLDRSGAALRIVRRYTTELRQGWHAAARAARAHVQARGIPLDSCVLVYTWFTQDARFVENVLLVSDGRIYAYRSPNGPDVPDPLSEQDIATWVLDWRPADADSLEPYEALLEAGRLILE